MTAPPILHEAACRGISITLQGDKLKVASSEQPPAHFVEAIRQHRADIVDHLKRVDAKLIPPRGWIDGVARLADMLTPARFPAARWTKVVADATRFLETWAANAHRLGWQDWELFRCHRQAPWHRIQGLGLVLLLQGNTIVALTATEAAVRTRSSAAQTFRRKLADPLHPAERCLIWELDHG
jgi:hypothetical protein